MIANLIRLINLPPKNLQRLVTGGVLFFLFLVLTFVVSFGKLNSFDLFLTHTIQQIIPRTLDLPLSVFSVMGSAEITTAALIFIAAIIFRKNKIVLPSLGLFGVVLVFELIGKFFVNHPGPPKIFFRYALPFATPQYLSTSYSFPSGHASRTTFLLFIAAILTIKMIKNKTIKTLLLLFYVLFLTVMIVSRVYLGEHWSSDVLGGLFLGSAMGAFAMVYYE